MQAAAQTTRSPRPLARVTDRYARCVATSKRVRWEIDRDVIRSRGFDFDKKFLPDGLSKIGELSFLNAGERRFLSQIQGRTYANTFGLVERFIGPKLAEVSRDHWLGDQAAFEALVRFTDEELKHQGLFRRLDAMAAAGMPAGYVYAPQPNDVAGFVLGKSTWWVLALTCHIEIFVLQHYHQSIDPDRDADPLWKDVFLFHAREEAQRAILDELEWQREDEKLTDGERDRAVDDLIELVAAVDGALVAQSTSDAQYFANANARTLSVWQRAQVEAGVLRAYRWQHIVSGVQDARALPESARCADHAGAVRAHRRGAGADPGRRERALSRQTGAPDPPTCERRPRASFAPNLTERGRR